MKVSMDEGSQMEVIRGTLESMGEVVDEVREEDGLGDALFLPVDNIVTMHKLRKENIEKDEVIAEKDKENAEIKKENAEIKKENTEKDEVIAELRSQLKKFTER